MFERFRRARDFREEVEAHLLLEADRLRGEGLSDGEAIHAARRLFGNPTRAQERFYESRSWSVFNALLQDSRFGLRVMAKNLGTTALATLTLALAMGVNTAIFSLLNAALWRSLPGPDPGQLLILTNPNASMILGGILSGERYLLTWWEFCQLRDRAKTLSGLFASEVTLENWTVQVANTASEQIQGRLVSESYFSVFGVQPTAGRFFTQQDATGVGKDPYAVISYDYWQNRFGGKASIVGMPIRFAATTLIIIGVAPQNFRGETVGQAPAIWIPLLMQPLVKPGFDGLQDTLGQSQNKLMWLHVFARRKPGVTTAQVQSEVSVLFRNILRAGYPPSMRKQAQQEYLVVKPVGSGAFHGREEFARQWAMLSALAGLVLLVACANVANLLFARSSARTREIEIRFSIGAARSRLVRQLFTEGLLLALLGGTAGLLVSELVLRFLLQVVAAANDGFTMRAVIDARVLAFSVLSTLLASLLFGLAPGVSLTRSAASKHLRETGAVSRTSRANVNFACALVVFQVALSLLLATGAGLFVRTVWNLQSVELGYPRDRLLLLQVDSWSAGYRGKRATRLFRDLADRISALPGIKAVTYSDRGLFNPSEGAAPVEVPGFTSQKEEDRGAIVDGVGPLYFSTIGIPLLRGREIDVQDINRSAQVCVINEAFAKRFFGNQDPIGRQITTVASTEEGEDVKRSLEVIGVASDARVHSIRGVIDPKFYAAGGGSWFEVRTSGQPDRLLNSVRRAIVATDPSLTVQAAKTLNQTLAAQNSQPRLIAELATGFGALALFLAAAGIYGLMAYNVARRKSEIGIRVALGADRKQVTGMILKESGLLIAGGLLAGLLLTAALARLLASQLYGISSTGPRWSMARYEQVENAAQLYGLSAMDPVTIALGMATLCVIGLLAAYLPAARAARIDPVRALRNQ